MAMTLKEKVLNCEKIRGTHVSLSDCTVCEILGYLGYDFIWVDMEHTFLSEQDVCVHLNAAKAAGTPVIVRVPQDDLTATKRILDMGADGIIFPMVHNAEEAKRLLSYTLYPPYGIRGFGPQRGLRYGLDDADEYIGKGHLDRVCRFIQVEHIEAVNDIEQIAQIPYLDGIIFGPNDLSGSIGQLGQVYGEDTTNYIRQVISVFKKYNKCIGVSTGSTDINVLKHWNDLGINMISAGADYSYVLEGAKNQLENLKKVQGTI